jgi:hypothetical protein
LIKLAVKAKKTPKNYNRFLGKKAYIPPAMYTSFVFSPVIFFFDSPIVMLNLFPPLFILPPAPCKVGLYSPAGIKIN